MVALIFEGKSDSTLALIEKYQEKYRTTEASRAQTQPSSQATSASHLLSLSSKISGTKENTKFEATLTGLAIADTYITSGKFSGSALSEISLTLGKNSALMGGFISTRDPSQTDTLTLGDGAKLILQTHSERESSDIALKDLTLSKSTEVDSDFLLPTLGMNSTVIDLATSGAENTAQIGDRKSRTLTTQTLTINGSGSKDPIFRLRARGIGDADRVVVRKSVSNAESSAPAASSPATSAPAAANQAISASAQVFLDVSLLTHDFSADATKTYVFEVGGDASNFALQSLKAQTGFTEYTVKLGEETGSGAFKKWYLTTPQDVKINEGAIDYTGSVLGLNYNIFTANVNSLNKRMGELRNNPKNQGVWARIFGGKMTNKMEHIPSDTTYVTFQGGYDYGFDVSSNAKNYLGMSIAYGRFSSKAQQDTTAGASIVGFDSKTNNIEVGIYNSYIQDEGWFSDSIAKFSYINSSFDISYRSGMQAQTVDNFAFSLGEEFGYRFALGANKNWFIDPQAEFVFGYLNATNLSQKQEGQTLNGKLDDIFMLRTRVGSDFGYTLKKDGNAYDFRLGLSYEYDLANADSHFSIPDLLNKTFKDTITSDGRLVLNVGTNMSFKENVRVYVDFEKSFIGKLTTDYQVSAGVRYSFGEVTIKTQQKLESTAPLKLEDARIQKPNQEDANNFSSQLQNKESLKTK